MPTSKTEQILSALEATLAATAGVGSRVYRDRAEAFLRAECPPPISVRRGRGEASSSSSPAWVLPLVIQQET